MANQIYNPGTGRYEWQSPGYDANDDATRIKSLQKKWRSDFIGSGIDDSKWDVSIAGGMTYSVANGLLTINTGTSLDDEFILLSKEMFTIPVRAMVALNMSQRIANQTVFIEFVSCDPITGVPDEICVQAWRLDGTSATRGIYEVCTGGNPRLMSAASAIQSTANTDFSLLEIEAFTDEAWFHGRAVDTSASRLQSYVRHQQIPDPNRLYKLRIRVKNRQQIGSITAIGPHTDTTVKITRDGHGLNTGDNVTVYNVVGLSGVTFPWTGTVTVIDANNFTLDGTAGFTGTWVNNGWAYFTKNAGPASNTVVNVSFVAVTDYAELTAEITSGRGASNAGQALAVQVTGGIMVSKLYSSAGSDWQYSCGAGGITVTTDQVLKAAGAAGISNYLTGMTAINTGAQATELQVKDGATVIWRMMLPANMIVPVNIGFLTPLRGTAATAMNAACSVASTVYLSAQGYQSS